MRGGGRGFRICGTLAGLSELRRSFGLFDATMVNVGVMVGSAVFLTAGDVARALPHPLLQLAVWVVAAVFSLAGALTIAELGASFPQAGGLTVYLREAFGPAWGFLYGWALFVVIQTAAIAAVGVAFATYCGHFFQMSPLQVQLLAAAIVTVLSGAQRPGRPRGRRHPEPVHGGQAGGHAGPGRARLRRQRRVVGESDHRPHPA